MICTYNSAQRLPETLKHVAAQRVPDGLPWEVVIIDTGSSDDTKEVARRQWEVHGSPAPLHLFDSPPGLPAARREALRRAPHDLVVFCDDDNWLDEAYLRIAHGVMDDDPNIGVLGGRGEAVFEADPPTWFPRAEAYFAVGPQSDASGDISDAQGYVYGAGCVVRKSAWKQITKHGEESLLRSFRRGSNDKEMCYLIRLAGYTISYDERLRFQHFMPAARLEWRSFLAHGFHAHKTATLLEPYTYVLGQDEYSSPSRWRWLGMASSHVKWLIRRSPALLPPHNKSGSWARFRHACRQGNLAGLIHMRQHFKGNCDRVHALQLAVRSHA